MTQFFSLIPITGIYFVSITHYRPEECLAVVRRKVLHGLNVNLYIQIIKTFYRSFKTDL